MLREGITPAGAGHSPQPQPQYRNTEVSPRGKVDCKNNRFPALPTGANVSSLKKNIQKFTPNVLVENNRHPEGEQLQGDC